MMSSARAPVQHPSPFDDLSAASPVSERRVLFPEHLILVAENDANWGACMESFWASETPVSTLVQTAHESSLELAARVEARVDELLRAGHSVGTLVLIPGSEGQSVEARRRAWRAVVWSAIRVGVRRVVLNRGPGATAMLEPLANELRALTDRMGIRFDVVGEL